jgi:hypothetical protein
MAALIFVHKGCSIFKHWYASDNRIAVLAATPGVFKNPYNE